MEINDLMSLKALMGENHGMSDYEETVLAHKQSGRANATTVTAIVAAFGGVVAAIGVGFYASAKSCGNQQLIAAYANHTQQIETLLGNQIAQNRTTFENAKAAQDSINITTTQSGTQNTSVSQSALAQAEATLLTQSLTGRIAQTPQEVVLTSKQYCPCPASNCCS